MLTSGAAAKSDLVGHLASPEVTTTEKDAKSRLGQRDSLAASFEIFLGAETSERGGPRSLKGH